MAGRIYIDNLEPAQLVDGVFTMQNCQLGQTKNGKPFIKCILSDKSGRAPGRLWNASEDLFEALPTDGFVHIEGQSQPYQGEMQIIISQIKPIQPSADQLTELLPATQFSIEDMFQELIEILNSIKSPSMKALAAQYLKDQNLMDRFRQAPAAMALHHAYIGGLLEHTLALLRLAETVLPLYPKVNRDIVLIGLFLHDLGKCVELTWDAGFSYTDDGLLVGHVARGTIWLELKARQCAEEGNPIPSNALLVLQHIILSHHGQHEYGALKLPATPEAILIHHLDNLDAKMQMSISAAREGKTNNLGGNFTEKIWALDTRIFRPDPLAEEA